MWAVVALRAGGCMLSNRGGEVRFLKSASVLGFPDPRLPPAPLLSTKSTVAGHNCITHVLFSA